jgi:hypothetical protein
MSALGGKQTLTFAGKGVARRLSPRLERVLLVSVLTLYLPSNVRAKNPWRI